MRSQTLQSEMLPENGKHPCSFPLLRKKVHGPSIASQRKEGKRQAAKPYFAGGPTINPGLLRKLDIFSSAYHRNKQDPLKRGVCLHRLEEVEWDIVKDRGGVFDDR